MSPAAALEESGSPDLRRHPPFDALDAESWQFLATRAEVRAFAEGSVILSPGQDAAARLEIVLDGRVGAEPIRAHQLVEDPYPMLEAGEMFPLAAVFAGLEVTSVYRALGPTRCWSLAAPDVTRLARRSPAFLEHCLARVAALLRQARRDALAEGEEQVAEQQSMGSPLAALVRHAPVQCPPHTSVRAALEAMGAAGVGSIVVTGDDARIRGIFTLQDLLRRVLLVGASLDTPIEAVMTAAPLTLAAGASAYDAALLMAQHDVRHVPVLEEGKVVGVVSQRDLFSAQRVTLRQLPETIAAAADLAALQQAARDIRDLARAMLTNGVAAERLTQFIAALNDRLTQRLLGLEMVRHDLADLRLCWIALGSEGRLEQTLATDQDNGIIFLAPEHASADAARARLLPFAHAVNAALDACGYPLCKGGIMASNPRWCLSLEEWEAQFAAWMRNPDPEALLNSTIFFDFRAVFGDAALADRLRAWLQNSSGTTPLFLHHLAQGALQTRPPLGWLRAFRFDGTREFPHTIDLKLYGLRPYVEAARIRALQFGIAHTNTGQRLRLAAPRLGLAAGEVQAMVDGFYVIQMLRLRHQVLDPDAVAAPNRIDPDRLNVLDRRMLKEAFLQARALQQGLELDYPRTR